MANIVDLATLITTFMLSVGSPTWVVNDYVTTKYGAEVDVQTTTNPVKRYIIKTDQASVTRAIQVPVDDVECQKAN